jgi:LuxR family maltose regulon positive regulatory protein
VAVLAAPAGFGKTTLLAEWRATPAGAALPLAWVSLDAGDNDPVRFWSYVHAGLEMAHPGTGEAALATLRSPGAAPEAIAASVVRDLADLQEDLALVLDDYHLIEAEAIHRGVAFLLDHLPATLHLVILSRVEPFLPLARLRAGGRLVEIGAQELRFTPDETASFLSDTMGLDIPHDVVAALGHATEGWAAGLQLGALALERPGGPGDVLARFSGGHRYVVDYLVEEVLQQQTESVRAFLLHTSILGRLSGELGEAVTGEPGGQAMLERLERANLFVVPLDGNRRWYRYHHLFGEALRHHLQVAVPAAVPGLHARAATWFEQQGLMAESVEHSLTGGDWPAAMRRLEPLVIGLTDRGERATIDRWIMTLPEQALVTNPRISVSRAWTLFFAGEIDAAERLGETAAARADAAGDRLAQGQAGHLRAHLATARGDGAAAVEHGRRAFALLPAEECARRGSALLAAGIGHVVLGDLGEAASALQAAADLSFAAGQGLIGGGSALIYLGLVRALQGELTEAERLYRDVLDSCGEAASFTRTRALVRLGDLLREQNDLAGATELLEAGVALDQQCGGLYLHEGYLALARLHSARGQLETALEAIAQAETAARRRAHRTAATRASAFAVRLRLAAGDRPSAARWAERSDLGEDDLGRYEHEAEVLTLVRVWTALGRHDDVLGLLARLREPAEAAGRAGSVVEHVMLAALAQQGGGDRAGALATAAQALARAEGCGYLRLIADEGAPMARLVEALASDRRRTADVSTTPSLGYLRRLLAAIGTSVGGSTAEPAVARVASDYPWALAESLSARELEVLRLMATGVSNQQIADRLVVSVTTVKTHVNNLFRKLDAKNRIEAVARARGRGLIGG